MNNIRLAIHGGAGVMQRHLSPPGREQACHQALAAIIRDVHARLQEGCHALDAVELAVRALEDCELFNAGRGSVLNADGDVEMDAAIMNGQDRRCGAVMAIKGVPHPVSVARHVMENTEHIALAAEAARRYAESARLELCEPSDLIVSERREQLASARKAGRISLDHDESYVVPDVTPRMGTVGAVARDGSGNIAAATSTGGMTNKLPGRIGDSPLIGCGTWADRQTCAISATGEGEYFIRGAIAHDVHARIRYGKQSLAVACQGALDHVAQLGGSGGLIAIGSDGTVHLPFNTPGMYRGWVAADGTERVAVYGDDE